MASVFATCDIGAAALGRLREAGHRIEVHPGPEPPTREELVEAVSRGIEGLIPTVIDPVTKEVLQAGRGTLKVVAQYGVGYDNIDIATANRLGIPVTNTPDVLTDATAEFAFFMLGDAARKLYPSERLVRENRWTHWHPTKPFLGKEVSGKTVGIVGLGRIGKSFALKWAGWDVDILAHTRTPDEEFGRALRDLLGERPRLGLGRRRFRYVGFEECLGESDFLSLHVPLTPDTRGMIGEEELKRMKSSAILVNTTRGPVVDESALAEALKDGEIAGAALDVYHREPLPGDSPLRDPALDERLRLYHHFGSGTEETRLSADPEVGMAGRCVQCALEILGGKAPSEVEFLVNPEAFG